MESTICAQADHCHGGDTEVRIKYAGNIFVNKASHTSNVSQQAENDVISLPIKKMLKNRYKCGGEAHMASLLWEDDELNYPLHDYYVDLKVEEEDLMGTFAKDIISLSNIFYSKDEYGLRDKRMILVTGDAGYGKTSLARKLSYDWATLEHPSYISRFDILLNIPLIAVRDKTPKELLRNALEINKRNLDIITSVKLKWLIILDGFDEATEPDIVFPFLGGQKEPFEGYSENVTVIVTSRPYVVKSITHLFDRRLSILGLSVENQIKYIKAVFAPNIRQAEKMITNIETDTFLNKAAECPLLLHMLCCVYGKECNSDHLNITSRTILYVNIFKLLMARYVKKHGEPYTTKSIKDSNITDDIIFIKLGEIARDSLRSICLITEEVLRKVFTEEKEYTLVLRLGILLGITTRINMKVIIKYDFFHRTFAEFLEAVYILHLTRKVDFSERLDEILPTSNDLATAMFVSGLFGKEFVKNKTILLWLTRNRRALLELAEIKNEADLDIEHWEQICSLTQSIEYNHTLDERKLLLSGYMLTNFREVAIRAEEVNNEFWAYVNRILKGANSRTEFSIRLSVSVVHVTSPESNVAIRFLNMEKTINELLCAGTLLRKNRNNSILLVYIHPADTLYMTESNHYKIVNPLMTKPVGIMPKSFCSVPECQENSAGGVWKLGNIKICYSKKFGIVKAEKTNQTNIDIIPILVVTEAQYSLIRQEDPFYYDSLKATDFKNSPMSRNLDDFRMPKQLGYVDSKIAFERLRQSGCRTNHLRDWTSDHTLINSLQITVALQKRKSCIVI